MSRYMEGPSGAARTPCSQFDSELPAYLEGEDRPYVVNHASQCPYCGVVLADLEVIQSQLPDTLMEDPPARLWSTVRATLASEGIIHEPVAGWRSWFPQYGLLRYSAPFAALASLILLATVLMLKPTTLVPPSMVAGDQIPGSAAAGTVNESISPSQVALTMMEKSFHESEKSLDPVILASYQKGLKSLDNSIQECEASVRKDPGDTLAREYLNSAYEQKAAMLTAALEFNGQ